MRIIWKGVEEERLEVNNIKSVHESKEKVLPNYNLKKFTKSYFLEVIMRNNKSFIFGVESKEEISEWLRKLYLVI